jgi:hypothetical protein
MSKMHNVNRSSIVLALLAIAIVVAVATTGLLQATCLFSKAYAHTFTPDDSSSFLSLI